MAGPAGRALRIGITLAQFADTCDAALDSARRAEAAGLDGVFVFDHLWPMGQPGRPALSAFPLLGAAAAVTGRIALGTLVARIGLLADEVLLGEMAALSKIAPGRVIAGLGVGDSKSADENTASGVMVAPETDRLNSLTRCAVTLKEGGTPVWLGGRSEKIARIARHTGAALNLWDASLEDVSRFVSSGVETTWGGPLGRDPQVAADTIHALAEAGASWTVWGWPESPELVARAVELARRRTNL